MQPPIEPAFFAADLGGIGDALLRLWRGKKPAFGNAAERRRHQSSAENYHSAERPADVALGAIESFLQEDRTGIEPFVHLHDRDPGLSVAGQQRPLDRRRAAPARQQRGVHIETAEPRRCQDRPRQNQTIRGDHRGIGAERSEGGLVRLVPQVPRTANLEALLHRQRLNRRGLRSCPRPAGRGGCV